MPTTQTAAYQSALADMALLQEAFPDLTWKTINRRRTRSIEIVGTAENPDPYKVCSISIFPDYLFPLRTSVQVSVGYFHVYRRGSPRRGLVSLVRRTIQIMGVRLDKAASVWTSLSLEKE